MKRWMIETRAIVNRTYFVDGDTEDDAENSYLYGNVSPDLDEEVDEEIKSITEVETEDAPSPQESANG